MSLIRTLLFLSTLLATNLLFANEFQAVEPKLIGAMHKVSDEKLDDAIEDVKGLLKDTPRFQLAQLVYADLLMAKAGMPQGLLGETDLSSAQDKVHGLRHEARVRWRRYQENISEEQLPEVLLKLSDEQKTVVVTDLERSRLYLYENDQGEPRLLADFYVTHGKKGKDKRVEGDHKTPVGTYFVTSSLDVSKLPDLYGSGAYPIDYPNAWDRRHGKTGHGIWLHGVPSNTYSRVPLDTRGCLAMSNPELDAIKPFLDVGVTPVIISSRLNWRSQDEITRQRRELENAMHKWESDWESRNVSAYLKHYSKQFRSDGKDYRTWAKHKHRVNGHKKYIDVDLSNISILGYPDQKDMVIVSYEQDYKSSNFKGTSNKRQYWQKESDGVWRIVYEGKG